jgi:outer membrane translocation and assembly module TamA
VRLPWDLTGLAFLDAGQVWDEIGSVDGDFAKALGLGLRARTPIGLLRFDAGFPLDRRPGDPAYRLYVGFGHAF